MKKILIVLSMLLLLISCGKGKDKSDPLNLGGNKDDKKQSMSEIQKYNSYIGVYNDLLSLDGDINSYFEDAGDKEQFQKPNGSVSVNFSRVDDIMKKIKEASSAKPAMVGVDKTSKDLVPVLEELLPLTQDMKAYYDGKDYTSDNYKKAQEFHTKFLAVVKKYDAAVLQFRAEMEKVIAVQKEKEAKELQKAGRKIDYSKMQILSVSEEILAEIRNQNLNGANFTSGDPSKFKPLQEKLINIVAEFQKVARDPEQLKKEGYESYKIDSFMRETNDFKASVANFVQRMEAKKKIDNFHLQNSFFLENEDGSPENVVKSFNELVGEYNSLNR